jgi:hypothetical protein
VDIRPRTTGEILDDAWRLALADAPFLLLFAALFLIPTFIVLLFLLAQPAPSGMAQCALPALAAFVLPLTGLASGACQELFRRRAADEPVSVGPCLTAALRHGLEHAAARAVSICGVVLGLFVLLIPGLALWASATSVHASIAAGKGRSGTLFRDLGREAAFAPLKSTVIVLSRLALICLVVIELHLLSYALLWIADDLAGFDVALLRVELSFWTNSVYTTMLFLLAWLLLTPFFEASNFLLHTDVRTRREGLDLQYRVRRVFASLARQSVGAAPLVLAIVLMAATPAAAAEKQLDTVRAARQEIETIRDEVKNTEPYRDGRRWVDRLHNLEARLARSGDGNARRFRWFERALDNFADRKREDALNVLDDLRKRLSLLEDSLTAPQDSEANGPPRRAPEDVKSLLRGKHGPQRPRARPAEKMEEQPKEPKREKVRRDDPVEEGPRTRGGGGPRVRGPSGGGGGLSSLGWILLAGLGLAVVAAALFLYFSSPRGPRAAKPPTTSGVSSPHTSEAQQILDESPSDLWRQAEKLAGEGKHREAVRLLYLAVLALLHRQHFIRFEPTRTNGEYVRQVHLSEQAPAELHEPFLELTQLFEMKWYGERACESGDYRTCHALAEQVQKLARSP